MILDRVTDVRNLGAIARTALCAGVDAIVVPYTETAPVNDDAVKTSAGALLKIPVCREKHLKTTLEYLNQSGFTTVACTEKARHNFVNGTIGYCDGKRGKRNWKRLNQKVYLPI